MKNLLISLINFYQTFLSFDTGALRIFAPNGACRFEVTCSEYTKQAIMKFGVIRGIELGARRLYRCR